MWIERELALLPTKNKSKLVLIGNWNRLSIPEINVDECDFDDDESFQHLYLLSDEEIEEGDCYIHFNLNCNEYSVHKADEHFNSDNNPNIIDNRSFVFPYWDKKIIATTDNSLRIDYDYHMVRTSEETKKCYNKSLPLIPQSFIEHYISEFNKGNKIEKVMVEYEEFAPNNGINLNDGYRKELKVLNDNIITIKQVKDSWSREELYELLRKAFKVGHDRGYSGYPNTDNWSKPEFEQWIQENL